MVDLDTSLIFKALAHPVCRQILTWLRDPEEFEPQEHPGLGGVRHLSQ